MMGHFPPAGAVFDIGGGNGYLTKAMRDAGFPAILVEPGAEGVRNAQSSGLCPLIQGNFIDIPWHPGTMPAAALFDVLEHIEDDMAFLSHLKRRCPLEAGFILQYRLTPIFGQRRM